MIEKTYTFNTILKLWLISKDELKMQSRLNYEDLINRYITLDLGVNLVDKITKQEIDDFFLKVANISISTQRKLFYIIKTSLIYAYDNGYCTNYLNLKNNRFGYFPQTIYILTKEEQVSLEEWLKNKVNIRKVCLLLCLYTGLRVGEVCGQKWDDIDFKNHSLIVKRTIERIRNKDKNISSKTILIESTPKSSTSNRIIPIPDFLIRMLKQFEGEKKYFLLSKSENFYDPRLFESFYDRTLKSCNISHNKFHTLRHTFATRCIESKMDIKTLSEILGHSSIEITLKLYVHPSYEMKKSSIENLVRFMANS